MPAKLSCLLFFLIFTSIVFSQESSESCAILTTLENPIEIPNMNNLRVFCDDQWEFNANVVDADYVYCAEGGLSMVSGTLVSAVDPNSGWCLELIFQEGMSWQEWSSQGFPTSYLDDSKFAEENYLDWRYAILDSGTLTGWGNWEGAHMELTHSPSNYYYGFQVGLAANGLNQNFGATFWSNGSGLVYNSESGMLEELIGCSQTFRFDFGTCEALDNTSCVIEEGGQDCLTSSTAELTLDQIEVYPNPSNGNFVINGLAPAKYQTISLYNLLGERVYFNSVFSERTAINTQEFVPGSYVLRVQGSNQQNHIRIIIQ